ncbi:S8 family serine peptidase [Rhodocytophaga rosea]|uniref:S8 family serine peptidase n=1 Tax=Rhodocytophaga rosea TaxID=2704465 RepID=A0A6C0GGK5_9BACT|nr:GEVED domain-containing protein [Rhodocytophaga rosea]QHT66810.1 S8 family serine peptidase [Rhodocytophaga rosea]
MKTKIFTLYFTLICISVLAQGSQVNGPEEYAYYSNGKKVSLKPIPGEIFVTFAKKVDAAKGSTYATQMQNQVSKPTKEDIFSPSNAVRYKVDPRQASSQTSLAQVEKQFKSNPDVVTAYPAFMVGNDKVYVGKKLMFSIKSGADSIQVHAFLKNNQSALTEVIDLGDKKIYVAEVNKGGSVFKVANGLFESGMVEYAEPDFTFTAHHDLTPNDGFYGTQWFLHQISDADIDAPEAWDISTGSASVVVAVIDGNGFDLAHPDLAAKLFNSYDAVNDDNFPWPENASANHGTPCAGLIGAATNNTTGVASVGFNVRVLPICMGFNASGGSFSTNSTIIARAAARVVATPGVVAVSNSYSFGSSSFAASVEASYISMRTNSRGGLGAVILASTANDGLNNPTVYPASYSNVVGVGASTSTDTRASFSNYGNLVDVVAPGVNTYTVDRSGADGYSAGPYTYFSGTSAACPVAAGVIGLMASVNTGANWATLMSYLLQSTDKVGGYVYTAGYSYGSWNNEMGYGRVNAFKALQKVLGPPTITAFAPVGGPSGTAVTIYGNKFLGTTSVTFNLVSASFTVVSAYQITAYVPAGATSGPIRVTNFAGTATSANFTITPYCVGSYTTGCTSGDYINNFSINTLVNNSSGCNGQPGGYINYSPTGNYTTTLKKGSTYTVSMQSGPSLAQGFGVWIDYNDDKDFADAGEFVYSSPTAGTGIYTGSVTIPSSVSTGLRKMRVRAKYASTFTADQACTTFTWGETEDYTVAIGYCVPALIVACTSGDYINNFSFNTLVNNGSGCNGQLSNYINYAPAGTKTTSVIKGQSYPISMQSGAIGQGFGVWIDYNNDQDFEDANEFVYSSPSTGTGVYSSSVTIPASVSTGQRRLRVRAKWNATFISGQMCEANTWGETEDYTITINAPVVAASQWNKRFGGSGIDNFSVVIKTSDGGYLLGGHSTSGISGDKSQASQGAVDYWIVKTDASGNKQWDKRFGGSAGDYLNTMIRTSDGGYLLGGNSLSGVSGDKSQASQGGQDFWIVKINSVGAKLWDKRFGGSGSDDLRTMHQLPSGEYVLIGYSTSGISGDKTQASQGSNDYWVVKINAAGAKLWDKRFGGSGDDWVESSVLNADGTIMLGGRSASGLSGDKSQASQGGRDFWVVKINAAGAKLWDKRFGGSAYDEQYAMATTSDGGYLLGGLSFSGVSGDKTQGSQGGSDFWIVKINSVGAKLWDKRFGGSLAEDMRSMVRTTDGGFLLGGKSDSPISGDKTQASQGGQDYWSVKINSAGTKQWDKRFGGSATEELRTVLQTSDGGYLLGGRSDSGISGDRTQSSQGSTDYWLVKLSSSGGARLASEQELAATEEDSTEALFNLSANPNPFTEKLTVGFKLPQTEQVRLKVYNSQGLEVTTLFEGEAEKDRAYEFEWRAAGQTPGMYIIRLGSESKVETKKVILTR